VSVCEMWTHPVPRDTVWSDQHRYCLDVQVMLGATCWIDHNFVRVKL